ncbi:hypothetical protein CEXT_498691 [Caerostris extrusa]|uniref:Uncharacterized protein n=1 Tax=Caerostris extrusa TaxID=172846 RepID=A0AAV4TIJ2_CAEEX|nr:hypothetical protein CEXT_498691 [Caerostris extrusa]
MIRHEMVKQTTIDSKMKHSLKSHISSRMGHKKTLFVQIPGLIFLFKSFAINIIFLLKISCRLFLLEANPCLFAVNVRKSKFRFQSHSNPCRMTAQNSIFGFTSHARFGDDSS